MGAIKTYFKSQFKTRMFKLQYENVDDFYWHCYQNSGSGLALLIIRGVLFLGSLGIVISSAVLTAPTGIGWRWLIYLTHWGILLLAISTGLGFLVSLRAYLKGSRDDDLSLTLPWFVKAYWVSYNIALPLAVFITIFYWSFLSALVNSENENGLQYAIDEVLDVFIHAINSVVMVALLLTARQPMHILHFYFVLGFTILYLIFSVIYYAAGGTDPSGNPFVYPMLDWNNPEIAGLTAVFSALFLIVLHVFLSFLTAGRDALSGYFTYKR